MARATVMALTLGVAGILSLLGGCQAKKVTAHGKVTFGSSPVKGTEREPVVIRFTRVDDKKKGQVFDAEVNQDEGTFTVQLPVGKYEVSISHLNSDLEDTFGGFFAEGASPITREVDGQNAIDIDLKAEGGQINDKSGKIPEHP